MITAEIVNFAKRTAYNCGRDIILKGFIDGTAKIEYKSSTDIVTSVDKDAEDYIVSSIKSEYPEHSVVAEEGNDLEGQGEYCWYIDPLDGTNNFAHGYAHFCVSIALYSITKKKMVVGVIYDPVKDEMFSAVSGEGAFLNLGRISVSKTPDLAVSVIVTGFPYDKKNHKFNNVKQFSAMVPEVQGVRRTGSAALDLCYVACGRFDGYWEGLIKPWDISAGALIVQEAGGNVSDYLGGCFFPETKEIVASNGQIHQQILNVIQKTTDYYPNRDL